MVFKLNFLKVENIEYYANLYVQHLLYLLAYLLYTEWITEYKNKSKHWYSTDHVSDIFLNASHILTCVISYFQTRESITFLQINENQELILFWPFTIN